MSRILFLSSPKAKRKIFQGDLFSTNFPNKSIVAQWISGVAGCSSHARRPFFRYRGDDDGLCDRMLELFALLAATEKQIDKDGRSPARVLDYRQRLAKPVWDQIIALSQSVIEAEAKGKAKNRLHFLWPKKSHLYQGCKYMVKHRKALMAYLGDPRLSANNNRAERLLRSEKILLVACKFRYSEKGRVVFDILRILVMTASGACEDAKSYLCSVLKQPDEEIKARPDLYTPLAFHQMQSSSAPELQATGS
ncbi:MAG: transposase [Chitinophagaceae bacterium]|nr:transposase [Oligoflexus sp.]